jgi:stage III sporulation protein SpoIIIAA
MNSQTFPDDVPLLLAVLPRPMKRLLEHQDHSVLLEIVMDLGRIPEARSMEGVMTLGDQAVTRADLDHVIHAVGEFGDDNRAGIENTLHRISAIRNRRGEVTGLTLRVGRAISGTIDAIRDLIESGRSLLLLGRPGVGKTTRLRETARLLADELGKRVIVIDTSNEIGGDGDIPHPAIGRARRMQVRRTSHQHAVMIEAVENHMPEVIVVDEIGTEAETLAARTIAERGVQLIGTAHGVTLENLVMNPTLSDLVGGVQTVVLGDDEARMRGTQKTVTERRTSPTFDAVVEIVDYDRLVVHHDTAAAVDRILRGRPAAGLELGPRGEQTTLPPRPQVMQASRTAVADYEHSFPEASLSADRPPARLYPYGVSRDQLERVIRELRLDVRTVMRPERADAVIALRSRAEDGRLRRVLAETGLPLHLVRKNTSAQLRRVLQDIFAVLPGSRRSDVEAALHEARSGIARARNEGIEVALSPRSARLRRLQHRVVIREHMVAESRGREPGRHLVIYPGEEELSSLGT